MSVGVQAGGASDISVRTLGVAMVTMKLVLAALLVTSCRVSAAPAEVDHEQSGYLPSIVNIAGLARNSLNALRYVVEGQSAVRDVQAPDVSLPNLGTLSGSTDTSSVKQRPIYQYRGVPFAKAPVGELRFKAPAPVNPWSSTFDASQPGKMCIQMDNSATAHAMRKTRRRRAVFAADDQSEDCLNLNVFSPNVDKTAKLPVLVFLHGGSFLSGSARDLPPNNLLDYDMILVTPQYRLGPLGFLNLNEEDVPGNAGLLDVIAALQWVHNNIEYFGGDPMKVTLAGHSAGAALASLAYLSPLSDGLIRGVMPMSGSSLTFWAWDLHPEVASAGVSSLLNCNGSNSASRVTCLQNATPADIHKAFITYAESSLMAGTGCGISGGGPGVQKAGTIALSDQPVNILKSGKFTPLPLLTGVVEHEGTYGLALAESGYVEPNHLMHNETFFRYDLIHVVLNILNVDDPAGFVADSAMGYFFDPSTLGDPLAMQDGLIDLAGAFSFKSGIRTHALYHAVAGQPTFLYSFSHYGPGTNTDMGIYHGADQIYLFPLGAETFNAVDLEMRTTMLDFFTNFVIYQNPTPANSDVPNMPTWEPYLRGDEHYMQLNVPSVLMQNFSQELTVARRFRFDQPTTAAPINDDTTPPPPPHTSQPTSPAPTVGAAPSVVANLFTTTASLAVLVALMRR